MLKTDQYFTFIFVNSITFLGKYEFIVSVKIWFPGNHCVFEFSSHGNRGIGWNLSSQSFFKNKAVL